MTEQPVETEQVFLGNEPRGIASRFAAALGDSTATPAAPAPTQAYLPNGHRLPGSFSIGKGRYIRPDLQSISDAAELPILEYKEPDRPLPGTPGADLMLTAETHAHSAVLSLSCGELDEGIAWLQSALAFAQNYRHAERHEGTTE